MDIDKKTLSLHINYILDRHEKMYDEMASRLSPEELLGVFNEMNVNSFGRAMAYLTLVYRMDIPEGVRREAVRLTGGVLKEMGVTRIEEESCLQTLFSAIKRIATF